MMQVDHVLLFRDKFYLLVTQRLGFAARAADHLGPPA